MRRTLRHMSWGLAAAGALGLTGTVDAAPTTRPVPAGQAVTSLTGASLVEKMKIELALLADPLTAGCVLEVHPGGDKLEVRGTVPSELARQHAVRLARANTAQPVADALRVDPADTGVVKTSAESHGDGLQASAAALVAQMLGRRAGVVEVQVTTVGQVVLRLSGSPEVKINEFGDTCVLGAVGSLEEKLALSRKIRDLPGCKGVVNHLPTTQVRQAGRWFAPVTADGGFSAPATDVVVRTVPVLPASGVEPVAAKVVVPAAVPEAPLPARMPTAAPAENLKPLGTFAPAESPKPVVPATPATPPVGGGWSPVPATAATASTVPLRTAPANAPKPGDSYVTTGFATFEFVATGTMGKKSAGSTVANAAKIKQSVKAAGGRTVRDVVVTGGVGNSLELIVKISNPAEAEALAGKILAVSDLVPYQVKLSFELAQ